MTLKETREKFLKENWPLYTDWVPIDDKKMKKKVDIYKKSILDTIITLSYQAGLERAVEIMKKVKKKE